MSGEDNKRHRDAALPLYPFVGRVSDCPWQMGWNPLVKILNGPRQREICALGDASDGKTIETFAEPMGETDRWLADLPLDTQIELLRYV